MSAIGLEDVRAAAARLKGRIHRTPVITSRSFDERCGCHVFFKCENLQRAGAFKIRGALNKLLTLSDEERARDVSAKTGRILVPPYDDPAIMAGQGTAALELMEEVPDLDALLTPMGGGGLMAGCSTVAKALRPAVRIYGVEADTANDTYLSFRKGERVTIAPPPTIADGIRNLSPGALTFPINKRNLDDVLLVSDKEIEEAVRFLLLRCKILVEPTGAVPAAAVLAGRLPMPKDSRVGIVLSGGNIDPALLVEILARA